MSGLVLEMCWSVPTMLLDNVGCSNNSLTKANNGSGVDIRVGMDLELSIPAFA